MKILIIEGIASSSHGGAEKSMSKFSEFLKEIDHTVFLVCEDYNDYGVSIENTKQLNLQPFSQQGLLSYVKTIIAIIKFIKKNRIELILTHCIHVFLLVRLVKVFTNVKSLVYFKWVYNKSNIGLLNRWGINSFDQYVAINEFVGNYWKPQISKAFNFKYIADGIKFPTSIQEKNINESKIELLYFGRIFNGKGLHILLEALSKLPEIYSLKVLGNFRPNDSTNDQVEYHNFIDKLIIKLNLKHRVSMVGHVSNVKDFIINASLVVVPSIIDDAQPFSILEALSYKCPAIGTNKGGIPYIYNINDFWYCEADSEEIAKKIDSIFSMPIDSLTKQTEELYNSVYKRYNESETQVELMRICEKI